MYSTCLFCNRALGTNEVVEHFPVGRRLAFDAARGRLWVVCRGCGRWNLTPLEERWEAIEEAERLFRDTRRRVSTDNVGLARLPEGLELVRIGAPQRPELAAWRYGDQFGKRRRRYVAMTAGAAVAGGAILVAGPLMGLIGLGAISPALNVFNLANATYRHRKLVRVPLREGGSIAIRMSEVRRTRLLIEDGEPTLRVTAAQPSAFVLRPRFRWDPETEQRALRGDDALRVAGALLPHVNQSGAGERQVREAVAMLEQSGDPARLLSAAAGTSKDWWVKQWGLGSEGALRGIPATMRLALEMAAHEDDERRALEGELAELEQRWKEAEEIAGIADSLTLPETVSRAFGKLKGERKD